MCIRDRYSPSLGYFNAGVLLVNLRYWRENNLSESFFEIINKYPERLRYHDQDVLNIVLKEIKLTLPLKYNVQHGYFFKDPLICLLYTSHFRKTRTCYQAYIACSNYCYFHNSLCFSK